MSLKMVLLIVGMCCAVTANARCVTQDLSGATTPQQRQILRATGQGWVMNATVCQVGLYEVAVPRHPKGPYDPRIMVFLHQKPLLRRMDGDTMLFNPNPKHADPSRPIVDIWSGKAGKDVSRIWYQTIPTDDGRSVEVYDLNFDGQPDVRSVLKGSAVVKAFAWYHNEWHKMGKQCIVISDHCRAARFVDGQWRLQN